MQNGAGEQVSAADYDPSLDRREDEHKRVWGTKDQHADVEMIEEEEEEEEDVDDMFAVATSDKKVKKVKRVAVGPSEVCIDVWRCSYRVCAEACYGYRHCNARFCRRLRRLLSDHFGRATRRRAVSSLLIAR